MRNSVRWTFAGCICFALVNIFIVNSRLGDTNNSLVLVHQINIGEEKEKETDELRVSEEGVIESKGKATYGIFLSMQNVQSSINVDYTDLAAILSEDQ